MTNTPNCDSLLEIWKSCRGSDGSLPTVSQMTPQKLYTLSDELWILEGLEDRDLRIRFYGKVIDARVGVAKVGQRYSSFLPGNIWEAVQEMIWEILETPAALRHSRKQLTNSGSTVIVHNILLPVVDRFGAVNQVYIVNEVEGSEIAKRDLSWSLSLDGQTLTWIDIGFGVPDMPSS